MRQGSISLKEPYIGEVVRAMAKGALGGGESALPSILKETEIALCVPLHFSTQRYKSESRLKT
jgi:hypothetical protein